LAGQANIVKIEEKKRESINKEKNMKVLIVDDHDHQIKALGRFLEMENIEYFPANDGVEALEILKEENIDCIVSDVHMDGMSGIDLFEKLKQDDKLSKIPVIIFSNTDTFEGYFIDKGADRYISKLRHRSLSFVTEQVLELVK